MREGAATWSALALVALFVALAGDAHADVWLAPSSDGHLGAFLAAGPIPKQAEVVPGDLHPAEGGRFSARASFAAWIAVDGGTGAFDLRKLFGAAGSRGVLSGELDVTTPFSGWLLVSLDGAVTASIDGEVVYRRESPHLRGGAWEPIPVTLSAGAHLLVLDVVRDGRWWAGEVRLLDAANLEPPHGVRIRLPGAGPETAARLAGHLVHAETFAGLVPGGFQPELRVSFPRGAPVEPTALLVATALSQGNPAGAAVSLGELRAEPTAVAPRSYYLPAVSMTPIAGTKTVDQVRLQVGAAPRFFAFRFDLDAARAVTRALDLRKRLAAKPVPTLSDPETTLATLDARVEALASFVNRRDASVPARAKRLAAFVDRVESAGDPLRDPGVLELARRSRIDGERDALSLHVPASYKPDGTRKYPLVIVLHGLGGNPEGVLAAFLGTDSLAPIPKVDGFVVAPAAHGDAFYRGPGELEVLDVIDWLIARYPIDPERVSITGHSMGGTGVSQIALRFPDRFSGAAALAGYHSFFVRRDVLGRPLRPWEITELTRWSPASFAENGRDLPLLVAQGTQDLPLTHSTSLAERYKALGYPLRETYPDIGHDVWRIVWGNADLWPALSSRRTNKNPSRINLKTDSLRYAERAWARVTALGLELPAELDATLAKESVVVRAKNVEAFELRPREAGLTGPATVVLDGQHLDVAERDPTAIHRGARGWEAGPLPRPPAGVLEKRAFLEGPIRDAWNGPLAFVYGTLDDRQTNAAREVAEHFRNRWSGDTHYPVIADRAATGELLATHSLFLVGSKEQNQIVRELDAGLPFGMDRGTVRAGNAHLTGDPELGFIAVYPNPKNPARLVVVVEAASAAGLYRAMSLPTQLPDFIVFDSGLGAAAGQQVLGSARVLGGGYFDRTWHLPEHFGDALAKPLAPPGAAPPATGGARRTPSSGVRAPAP